jgi:DNA-binding SARP family transcriptional activator
VVFAALLVALVPAVPSSAADLRVLPNNEVVVAQVMPNNSTVPVSGELRGPDSQADVTAVAWPDEADGYVADSGDRLVAFTVDVTEPASDGGLLGSGGPTLTLTVDGAPEALDTTAISKAVGQSTGSDGTGAESYVASVPNSTHDVDLSMDDSGFTQAFSLWSLKRTTPAPPVLYEGPFGSGPGVQLSVSKTLTLRFQGAGTYPAQVIATSAALSAFNPDGTNAVAPPDDAYLVLGMVADNNAAEMNQLDFPTALTPLAGSAVTFRSASGRRYVAEASNQSQDASNASVNDDGLLDATYAFLVPSTTTRGVVSIGPATTTGGFSMSPSNVAIDVSRPVRFSVGFPADAPPLRQPKPPWIGEPDPATGLPNGSGPVSGGFPVLLALAVLAAVIAAVLVLRGRIGAVLRHVPGGPPSHDPVPDTTPVTPVPASVADATGEPTLQVHVMGSVRVYPVNETLTEFGRAFVTYLAMHQDRPRTVDDAQTALWPISTEEDITRKTFLNYVTTVRRAIGTRHLPDDVQRNGYRLEHATTDWHRFRALVTRADRATGTQAHQLRRAALELVQGVPFESELSRWFQWTDSEGLRTAITKAIVVLAVAAHAECVQGGDLDGAEWALRQGLLANPFELTLWECLVDVVQARDDLSDLERFWRDASAALDQGAIEMLRDRVRG